jgi:putative phosphonate metabolism protein
MTDRYALYFAPEPGTPLDRFGNAWLGRDARTGEAMPPSAVPGLTAAEVTRLTAAPRRYGFHATLKPPFALAEGQRPEALFEAISRFAAQRLPLAAPPLRLARLDGFLALVPSDRTAELHALADDCVVAFDAFRAAPGEAELARRRAAGLTPRQGAQLRRWGYPYVFEDFRFHMTLTGTLAPAEQAVLMAALAPLVAPFGREPLPVRAVSLFAQPAPDQPFRRLRDFHFASAG